MKPLSSTEIALLQTYLAGEHCETPAYRCSIGWSAFDRVRDSSAAAAAATAPPRARTHTSTAGPYGAKCQQVEGEIRALASRVHAVAGIHERSLGLSPVALWDLPSDRQALREEGTLQVVKCSSKVSPCGGGGARQGEPPRYVIGMPHVGKVEGGE